MKRRGRAVSLLALWVLALAGDGWALSGDYRTYRDEKAGFKFQYPWDWATQKEVEGLFIGVASLKDGSDDFQENVNVIVQSLAQTPMTLPDYTTRTMGQLQSLVRGLKVLESSDSILSGEVAHRVVYTAMEGPWTVKRMQIWTLSDDKAYLITYTALPGTYTAFYPDVEQILSSFEIL